MAKEEQKFVGKGDFGITVTPPPNEEEQQQKEEAKEDNG